MKAIVNPAIGQSAAGPRSTNKWRSLLTTALAILYLLVLRATAANPTLIGSYTNGGWSVCISSNRAYLANPVFPRYSLEIVDVSNPASPYHLGTYKANAPVWGVAVAADLVYVGAEATGLIILSASNPASPVRIGGYNTPESAYGVSLVGNLAYVADGQSGLVVIDVTNPRLPRRVGGLDGCGEVRQVAISGNYAYLADRFWNGIAEIQPYGALRVMDISDPARPKRVAEHQTEGQAWALAVAGNFAYVSANTLEVFDVSDPASPRWVNSQAPGGTVAVEGNRAFVVNCGAGLNIFDITDPANPSPSGHVDIEGCPRGVAVVGRYAYVVTQNDGLKIYDVGQPAEEALPTLKMSHTGEKLEISWAAPANGFTLEWTDALDPATTWQPEPTIPELVAEQKVVTLEIGSSPKVFRLRKP